MMPLGCLFFHFHVHDSEMIVCHSCTLINQPSKTVHQSLLASYSNGVHYVFLQLFKLLARWTNL